MPCITNLGGGGISAHLGEVVCGVDEITQWVQFVEVIVSDLYLVLMFRARTTLRVEVDGLAILTDDNSDFG